MNGFWWIVQPAAGLPARFADQGKATDYAMHVHGVRYGPLPPEAADALILQLQRALLDGASPMERH